MNTALTPSERMNTEQYLEYNRLYNQKLKAQYLGMLANKAAYTAQQIDLKRIECCSLGIRV